MSVRATERLIGDLVIVTGLPDSPAMVVKAIDEKTKLITAVWFGDCKCYQEGTFPAAALDRTEEKKAPAKATKGKAAQGRKPAARR